MTDYATEQDIIDRYSNDDLLLVADRDDDGTVDSDVVALAITDASAEIDTYLAKRYDTPLSTVPTVLTRLCVDIVMYRLAATADVATEERRKRFEDAERLLTRISKGDVSLGLSDPPKSSTGIVMVSSPGRRFGRGRLL